MPELSRFFGIIVRMYMEVEYRTVFPFPCVLSNDVAVFGVNPVELIAGSLPRRQTRLVEAWAELHQTELLTDWERLKWTASNPH